MIVWARIADLLVKGQTCALVSVVKVEGSAPREAGARMLVTQSGYHGTIGGGTLEWKAIAMAQAMLGQGGRWRMQSFALGPELGQCCGGRVKLAIESFDAHQLEFAQGLAQREAEGPFTIVGRMPPLPDFTESFGVENRHLYLFGAGHVGRALVLALAQLPFAVQWCDPRPGAFPEVVPANVTLHGTEDPPELLREAPHGSFVLVMTHSHALDLAITDAALRNPACAEVGVIGSATKRARFESRLLAAGVDPARVAGLNCPIGMPGITSKLPAAIALSTAAQMLLFDDRLKACKTVPQSADSKWQAGERL